MEPSELKSGTARCDISSSKKRPRGLGEDVRKKLISQYLPADHDVHIIAAFCCDKLKAVVFNYASHPSTGGVITALGADYVGFARDRLAGAFPEAVPLFVQGFGGDQKPWNPKTGTFDHSIDEVKEHGDKLGDSVAQFIKSESMDKVEGEMLVKQTNITLEMEYPGQAVIEEKLRGTEKERRWAEYIKESIRAGRKLETGIYPFEIQTVSFNRSLAVVALAGEITVEHGFRLKEAAGKHFRRVVPVGCANDIVGYIPVRRMIPEGGYAVLSTQIARKRIGPFVESTEDMIHAAIMKQLGIK